MGKRSAPINCRRPGLDPLESRYLLSGMNDAMHAAIVPAMIIGLNSDVNIHDQAFSRPAIMPSISYGSPFAPARALEPAAEIPSWGGFSPAHTGFETLVVIQLSLAEGSPHGAFQDTPDAQLSPLSPPVSFSTTWRGGFASDPIAPPLALPGLNPFFSLSDLQKARIEEFVTVHGSLDPPAADPMAMDSSTNTDANPPVALAPPASQGAQVGLAVNPGVPAAAVGGGNLAASAHVSALLGVDLVHNDQETRIGRPEGTPNAPQAEAGQIRVASVATTVQGATDSRSATLAADGDRALVFADTQGSINSQGEQDDLPLPQSAGLITTAIPFDRAALERAVDQFFDQLEGLGTGQLSEQGTARVLPLSLTVLGAVTLAELARRRLRSRRGGWSTVVRQDSLGSEELLGFPELPGSWSTRLT